MDDVDTNGPPSHASKHTRLWHVAGVLLLAGFAAMSYLSERLSPEQPPETRPLIAFFICFLLSWCGYAVAFRLAWRRYAIPSLWFILSVALAARIIFLPSHLIQSDDCYRYVLDGQAVLQGINPFSYIPESLAADPPPHLIEANPIKARQVIERVNNPAVRTIYPPLAQFAFALGSALSQWETRGQRWAFLLCDLMTIGLLLAWLRRLGQPLFWIIVYAWNPVVIKEISNTAHLDSLVGLTLVLLIGILATGWVPNKLVSCTLSGLAMGAAILAKLYPLMFIPVCLAWVARGKRWHWHVAIFLSTTLIVVVLGYLPFMDVGLQKITEGMWVYSGHWMNNPGAFAVLSWIFDTPRPIMLVILGGVVSVVSLRLWFSNRISEDLIQAFQAILLAWLLFSPAFFPWYLVGLLAITTLRPRHWVVILTGASGFYYLLRYWEYHNYGVAWSYATQAVEHGLIWLWLAGSAICEIRARKMSGRRI